MRRVLLALVVMLAMTVAGSALGAGTAPNAGVDPKAHAGTSYRVSPLDVRSAQWTPGGFSYALYLG